MNGRETLATSRLRRFLRCEDGSSTLEALIWMPIIVYLLVMIADFSFVFFEKAQALRVIQDSNRALSVGHVKTTSEVEELIRTGMSHVTENVNVNTTVDLNTGIIKSVLTLSAADLTAVGSIPALERLDIVVAAQHFLEQ